MCEEFQDLKVKNHWLTALLVDNLIFILLKLEVKLFGFDIFNIS